MPSGVYTGSNSVPAPQYTPVRAATTYNGDISIPSSGTTATNGATFMWSYNFDTGEGGFTGKTWLLDNADQRSCNPLYMVKQLDSKDDVESYLESNNYNFNSIFSEWNPFFDTYVRFNNYFVSGGLAAGCAVYASGS